MARKAAQSPLNVYVNSRLAGRLRKQASGAIDFQYDPSWLAWEHVLPVSLSLPLRETRFRGVPVNAVFDNLLPDDDTVRRVLADRVHAQGIDAYSLLSVIGRDCIGALQFLPEDEEPGPAGTLAGRPVPDKEIADRLVSLGRNPLGVNDEEFRISLAGMQEKTALLYWKGKWHVPHGTTPTTHILKPEIGKVPGGMNLSDSVENEYFCMRLAAGLGLPVARTEIKTFNGSKVLVVERFDRLWTRDNRLLRLPQEDCCQALSVPPSRKYEAEGHGPGIKDVMELLQASDNPENDRRVFLKAQIFFWLLGATDGHAKNFSIRLLPGGGFHLTPLYDIMSAQPYVDTGQLSQNKMKLAMAVGDRRHYVIKTITLRHFVQTAQNCGIHSEIIENLMDEIRKGLPNAIDDVLSHLPKKFPKKLAASIIAGMKSRANLS